MPSPYVENYGIVTVTDATVSITDEAYAGRRIVLSRAAGIVVTLPAATGSGNFYDFIVTTTVTSNSYKIQVVGDDTMQGSILLNQDGADTPVTFDAAASSDTITLNGTTTGGLLGARVTVIDVAANLWHVEGQSSATGTEATPFSAAVS